MIHSHVSVRITLSIMRKYLNKYLFMRWAIFIIPFFLVMSCSSPDYIYISDDSFTDNIKLTKTKGLDILARIDHISLIGEKVVIIADRDSAIFCQYDLDGNLERSWGYKGQANNEYSIPMLSKIDVNSFMIYDVPKKRKEYYTIENGNIVQKETTILNNISGMPLSMHSIDNKNVIYDRLQSQNISIYRCIDGEESILLNSLQCYSDQYESSKAYIGYIETSPKDEGFVYAFQYIDGFDIYDSQGNSICRVRRNTYKRTVYNDSTHNKTFCFGLDKSEEGFILYRVNYTGKEILETPDIVTYIEEYDWMGKPLRRYELPLFASKIAYIGNGEFIVCNNFSENEYVQLYTPIKTH